MKGKRGQGLSMNTIVIAVIVLFVMVVLLLIFTGRISIFNWGLQNCPNNGGVCTKNPDCSGTGFSDVDGDGNVDAKPFQSIEGKNADKIGCTGFLPSDRVYCCKGIQITNPLSK